MKRTFTLALALAGALSVSGCYTPQQQTGTLAGGAIGAGGGALIGSALTGGSAGGAIAGGIHRRGHGRVDRQRRDGAALPPSLRAVGLERLRPPRLPRLVLINPRFTRHGYSSSHGAVPSRPRAAPAAGHDRAPFPG